MELPDISSSGEPHGYWCASRLWVTGLLAVVIIGTCALVIYSAQADDPSAPTLSHVTSPPVHRNTP